MTSWSSIVDKMGMLPDKTIHIMPECIVHLHGHRNKVMPFMKPFIFANFSNGAKFRNCTCWSTNDIRSHYFPRWISNHHIGNEDLVLLGHVKINS
jgi:hypothetical protein